MAASRLGWYPHLDYYLGYFKRDLIQSFGCQQPDVFQMIICGPFVHRERASANELQLAGACTPVIGPRLIERIRFSILLSKVLTFCAPK